MFKHSVLVSLLPLLMASFLAAQAAPLDEAQAQDEAEAQVERVIKAAQEINLDDAPALDLAPKNKSTDSGWYLRGQLANLTGSGSPEEMLLSSVPTFADGPRIESDVRVESYRLGYRIPIASGREHDALLPASIHSVVGLAFVDARYEMEGPQLLTQEQGIFKGAPLVGMEMDWPISRDMSFASDVSSTVPLSQMWIFSGRILARYHLAGRRGGGRRAVGGVGYERIWFEDRGDANGSLNRINSDSGPMLIFGVEARF
jgi:hypothetical protein